MLEEGAGVLGGSVSVMDRSAFCISDTRGDVRGRAEEGLFYRDTRHLSRFTLRVNGTAPALLSSGVEDGRAGFFMSLSAGGRPYGVSVMRRRSLHGSGMREEIKLVNHGREPVELNLELELDADFDDLMEVRGYRAFRPGEAVRRVEDGSSMLFSYERGGFRRATRVRLSTDAGRMELEPGRVGVRVTLDPRQTSTTTVEVSLEEDGRRVSPPAREVDLDAPTLHTDSEVLAGAWRQSVADLGALRFRLEPGKEEYLIAAGLPWFMTLFGRDSLITGFQTVFVAPDLAKNTLRALAARQASEFDDFRDAEPGKILHEIHFGELARFGETPHSPYYGTVDATPLFLILLHELRLWTADDGLAKELEEPARRALSWTLDHADSNGDGYADYQTRSSKGIQNQGWKDSGNCILFRDGTMAEGPIALCEAQGYLYDAWLRGAKLAEEVWNDPELAQKLRRRAAELKERFNRDFWIEDRGFYALALDGEGRRVDSLTSNVGHLLWSGIVPEERAAAAAKHLMDEALFSGWGVRTMAEGEGGYNPIEYHNGTVWPHDNALISYGLYRYGLREEANRVAVATLEAAPHFGYRLPEVFAGYARAETGVPVEYPAACSPQAWAAGTTPLLLRAMLGLEPDPENLRLTTDPALPGGVDGIRLEGVPAFGKIYSVEA